MAQSSRLTTATRISPSQDMLGESPIWDPDSQCLFWVDGVSRLIRSHDPSTGICRSIPVPSMIGSIGLATGGKLVAGLVDGIYLVDLETGQCDPVFKPATPDARARFNDGKVDRQGRYVCGTMGIYAEPRGELYRVDSQGRHDVLANGIRIANSLCFSPDGGTMYFADSLDRAIRAYRYSPGDEPLEHPRIFVDTSAFNSGPDGATVDAEGYVWASLVTVGKIARFTPTGQLDRLIEAPTDMPSCVTFGGPDLTTLFVTSIKDSGSGRAISRHPAGGHLFAIDGLGVKGLPEPRFGVRQAAP
ncbi:SMP-30/gluconolactonase/LRE family protein [uncultured Alsobacter sp.]|uniref:SMP-30/gluconolactonase/LRE family protein n=1 Tax=uncultured Alsobacter sp. TaxID=1748258 RepID=UPI0025DACCAE|nr:SMP-30/gluconolactonase/LRE family protein [uncultured Alsobacter sp.]